MLPLLYIFSLPTHHHHHHPPTTTTTIKLKKASNQKCSIPPEKKSDHLFRCLLPAYMATLKLRFSHTTKHVLVVVACMHVCYTRAKESERKRAQHSGAASTASPREREQSENFLIRFSRFIQTAQLCRADGKIFISPQAQSQLG
jgi:hypothetical protein